MIVFATISFCVSLRGDEVPLIIIECLNMLWKYSMNHRIPHMMMTLKIMFKGKNDLWWHCFPLADKTKSGIPTRMWIGRIIYHTCELEKQEMQFLFARDNGQEASIGDYDTMFRNFLEHSQNLRPELFTTGVLIVDFSLRRISRRGATMEAENNNVDTIAIK